MTYELEKELFEWALAGSLLGDHKTSSQISFAAWFLSIEHELNCFGENGPSNGWINGFMRRFPQLSDHKPNNLYSRWSEQYIRNWFEQIEKWLTDNRYNHLLQQPDRIFCADECNFRVSSKTGRVKLVLKLVGNESAVIVGANDQMSAMYTFSARGCTPNLFLTYKGKKLKPDIKQKIPVDVEYAMSDDGCIDEEAFMGYLTELNHQIEKKNIEKPVLLFLNGDKSNDTLQVSRLCKTFEIIPIRLYKPNHFRLLHEIINQTFDDLTIQKENFASSLDNIGAKISQNWITNTFKITGIYPWCPDTIDYPALNVRTRLDDANQDANTVNMSDASESRDSRSLDGSSMSEIKIEIKEEFDWDWEDSDENDTRTDSAYAKFLQIIGPELVEEFENPHFMEEWENKKKLYEVYQMLKRKYE